MIFHTEICCKHVICGSFITLLRGKKLLYLKLGGCKINQLTISIVLISLASVKIDPFFFSKVY